jgi:hypothetical protein
MALFDPKKTLPHRSKLVRSFDHFISARNQ